MKEITVDVKAGGEIVSQIQVKQFETVEEAVQTLTAEKCIALINRQYKADETNQERAAKTRPTSDITLLNRAMKDNPELQAQLEKLLVKAGLKEA